MTLSQARKRFPHVPLEIIKWALANIPDGKDVERGLYRLEEARVIELKYGV